ncbi:DUF3224 domain-containing protein [Phytomonospora sp. NPDC050363]|uniref:DUF3224 domain-containing protein n=1 Tax=Phytomonospora sp. NPDC050363 TaxID=3155642 RepID=UPI0033E1B493
MPHLTGTFDLTGWEPATVDDTPGAQLARVRITKTFHGDLAGGTSLTEILTFASPDESLRAYVGLEKFTGTIAGRTGSFVLQHEARAEGEDQSLTWRIVAGSGADGLAGITGEGTIANEDGVHRFTLDCEV